MAKNQGDGIPMDTPGGRQIVPGPARRLHGGDRSGLGEKGWAEDDQEPGAGHPGDTNIAPELHQPQPLDPEQRNL